MLHFRKAVLLFAFLVTLVTWRFHDSFLSMATPRYLALSVSFEVVSVDGVHTSNDISFVSDMYHFAFLQIKTHPQSFSHCCNVSRSSWRCFASSSPLIVRYIRQSSENNRVIKFTLTSKLKHEIIIVILEKMNICYSMPFLIIPNDIHYPTTRYIPVSTAESADPPKLLETPHFRLHYRHWKKYWHCVKLLHNFYEVMANEHAIHVMLKT